MIKPDSASHPQRFQWQSPQTAIRADALIKTKYPDLSRRIREALFSKNLVRINGRPVAKGAAVSPGDLLEVEIPGPLGPFPIPEPTFKPKVFFEDRNFRVLEKPGLVPTHPLSPFETGTLANALAFYWPQTLGVGIKPLEPGLVHRLDQGTSGLLVVASSQEAWTRLKKDLTGRRWEKTYLALVEGTIPEAITLTFGLAHDPGDPRKMKVIRTPRDTHRGRVYRAVTRILPKSGFKNRTLIEVQLITGVSHQIRVHLASQGHPVVGDTLYGSDSGPNLGLAPGRFFLHAGHLALPHPETQKRIDVSSELPEDLQKVLRMIRSKIDYINHPFPSVT